MQFREAMAIAAERDETTIIVCKDANPDHELSLWRGHLD